MKFNLKPMKNNLWIKRPISEAPKDGTVVLLWARVYHSPEHFKNTGVEYTDCMTTGRWLFGETWSNILGGKPTHFFYLPTEETTISVEEQPDA